MKLKIKKTKNFEFNLNKLLFYISIFVFQINFGQDLNTIFKEGNSAYNKGNFEKAISYYKEILDEGKHSSDLYFNIGNSYYRLNRVAESIFYYEKAKQLDPSSDKIQFNSSFAKNMTIDSIEELPKSQLEELKIKIFDFFSIKNWAILIVFFSWLFLALFLLYLFSNKSSLKRIFFSLSIICLFILISTFSICYLSKMEKKSNQFAIIFSNQLNIWPEPNERGEIKFILHKGTKVNLLENLDEWKKIRIANGSEGWIKNPELKSLNSN
jgi:tetratricopeptide (TPR) repeat protein